MRYDIIGLIAGWTLLVLTGPMAFVAVLGLAMGDAMSVVLTAFLPPILIAGGGGLALIRWGTRTDSSERIRDREAFAAVGISWPLIVAVGALPFWLGPTFHGPVLWTEREWVLMEVLGGYIRAWFESMSGFTTSGATVIDPMTSPLCAAGGECIGSQPRSIILWRSTTQWLGGMGVIMLGMLLIARALGGGMSIARAELTGPSLSRLRPRLQETARVLWGIYAGLTLIEFLVLMAVDLSWFDALNYSLTTMPSGGFGTTDAGVMGFSDWRVHVVLTFFMFLAGINFSLFHFLILREYNRFFADQEFRVYFLILGGAWVAFTANLIISNGWEFWDALRHGAFQSASIGTSTGYASADFAAWPVLSQVILLFLMIVGPSAGSTGGGLKVLRLRLAFALARREIERIVQPRAIVAVRMNGEVVEDKQMWVIIGMLSWWAALAMSSTVLIAILEPHLHLEDVLSIVVTALGNTGPALGAYGPTSTWASMNWVTLSVTGVLMWAGRLELLTVLVLFHPRTWRPERSS